MAGRIIRAIVIHCSASPNGKSLAHLENNRPLTDIETVDQWHHTRGFHRDQSWVNFFNSNLPSIGYHWLIDIYGCLHSGRHQDEIGAHVQGHNNDSIGVCCVGTDRFTKQQWESLAELINELRMQYPAAVVLGHRDFSPDLNHDGTIQPREFIKTCPGFDVKTWLANAMTPQNDHVCEIQKP